MRGWATEVAPRYSPPNPNPSLPGKTRHVRTRRRPAQPLCPRPRHYRRTAPPGLWHRWQLLPPDPEVVVVVNDENEVRDVVELARQCTSAPSPSAPPAPACAARPSPMGYPGAARRRPRHLHHQRRRQHRAGGPGIIGAEVNRRLAPLGRKIGPDPASINAAKIGGIAANNSSGMCCGTAQNSYNTLAAIRVLLADGTVLDTGDSSSMAAFDQPPQPAGAPCRPGRRRARRQGPGQPHPRQVQDQEHHRLQPQRAGRLRATRSTSSPT
jgi:hypothetical protein